MFSTKTPPLESCTKNLPFQLVSAAVTTPFTEIGMPAAASLAESANTSEAFVSVSFARATTAQFPQTNKRKKTDGHLAEGFRICRIVLIVMWLLAAFMVPSKQMLTNFAIPTYPSKEGLLIPSVSCMFLLNNNLLKTSL
jgi:hypothetical protein